MGASIIEGTKAAPTCWGDVLILGLGKSGKAAASYCLNLLGGRVKSVTIAAGEKNDAALEFAARCEALGAHVVFDMYTFKDTYDVCIVSPGISQFSRFYENAKAASTEVISEVEFAWRESPADTRWVAVTGTNGKTTTTSLITHILKCAGGRVAAVGNIGNTCIEAVGNGEADVYVCEASSFQLASCQAFAPEVAVLLNITPDHLDRYDHCMQNYVDAKMRILQNQEETDAFVYWNDDPIIRKELEKYQIKAKKCPFSILKKEGMIGYLADGQYVIEYPTPFNMEQESLALTGKHNMYNSLAAGITADIAGVKNEVIRQSLSDFEGVEHRLEKVVRVRGVDYINDSKATNVDACWYALESMKTPTVLILGGKDKGNDYEAIAELVRKKCVGLVFLGADNGKLHAFFDSFGIPIADTHSMKDCVEACYRMARPGDTVLLSPCCASFDLFKNMEDRGEQFKSLVRAL